MPIDHQQAQHLIQLQADGRLEPEVRAALQAHVRRCGECSQYAVSLRETEFLLNTVMSKHWNRTPLPLHAPILRPRVHFSLQTWLSVPTRSSAMALTALLVAVACWQFLFSGSAWRGQANLEVPAIPTPGLLLTSTEQSLADCPQKIHATHTGESLASLASRYGVTEQVIRDANQLEPGARALPDYVLIPRCNLPPTSTLHPPAFTNTPALAPLPYTPG